MNTQIFLSNLWKWKCGLPEDTIVSMGKSNIGNHPDLPELISIQIAPEFKDLESYGNKRMIMATFRYSLLKGHDLVNYDHVRQVKKRLSLYEETKNIEHLVDAYNFIRIEYLKAIMKGYPFRAIDDGEHAIKQL